MSLQFDQKEDLRLRMADLEKKLAESEEERCKLEKTCNVLMRAFREEEKMHYKALNQKYEKFLEDCTVRKRRNNIILRSLCRIEDRSRALFAKTERLKLLKDRYISCLNINDYKKEEIHSYSSWRTLPFSSPRYVQWTTPLATHLKTERLRDAVRDLLEGNRNTGGSSDDSSTDGNFDKYEPEKSEEKRKHEARTASGINVLSGIPNTEEHVNTPRVRDIISPNERGFEYHSPQATLASKMTINDKMRPRNNVTDSDKPEITFRDKKVMGYHESEALEKAEGKHFSHGNTDERHDPSEGKIGEKAHAEQSGRVSITQQNIPNDAPFPKSNNKWSRRPSITAYDEERQEEREILSDPQPAYEDDTILSEASPNNVKPLPKGLDGVDYQNETYPESYYEQPVHHHNHTSIASDVILEEDETEQEVDEEERKNFSPDDSFREKQPEESSQLSGAAGEPQWETETNKQTEEPNKGRAIGGQVSDEVRSRGGSESEKSLEGKQSDKSERASKAPVRSNLMHLLESDSESFQIEHGDVLSANEDSDFDFSFHQN